MNVVIFARKKSDRRIGRNATTTTTGFVTGRSVETKRPVMLKSEATLERNGDGMPPGDQQ